MSPAAKRIFPCSCWAHPTKRDTRWQGARCGFPSHWVTSIVILSLALHREPRYCMPNSRLVTVQQAFACLPPLNEAELSTYQVRVPLLLLPPFRLVVERNSAKSNHKHATFKRSSHHHFLGCRPCSQHLFHCLPYIVPAQCCRTHFYQSRGCAAVSFRRYHHLACHSKFNTTTFS